MGQADPRRDVVRPVLLLRHEVRMEFRRCERQGRGSDDGSDRHGERRTFRDHIHGRSGGETPPAHPTSLAERGRRTVLYAFLEKAAAAAEAGKTPMLPVWLSPTQVRIFRG